MSKKKKDKNTGYEKVGHYKGSVSYWHIVEPKKVDFHIRWRDTDSIDHEKFGPCEDVIDHVMNLDEDVFLIYRQLMLLSGYCPVYSYVDESKNQTMYTDADSDWLHFIWEDQSQIKTP